MSKVFFIGGAPRSGKSTALQKLIEQRPMLGASTDAIRAAAKSTTNPNQNTRLFKTYRGAFDSEENIERMTNNTDQALGFELDEAEETWKATLDFVNYYVQDGRDAAIEGVGVLPNKLVDLQFEFKAVFIVNLSDQTEVILRHAHKNKNDWLGKYDERVIRAFCHLNQTWNHYLADEAEKYGFQVIKVDADDFSNTIDAAVGVLLQTEE